MKPTVIHWCSVTHMKYFFPAKKSASQTFKPLLLLESPPKESLSVLSRTKERKRIWHHVSLFLGEEVLSSSCEFLLKVFETTNGAVGPGNLMTCDSCCRFCFYVFDSNCWTFMTAKEKRGKLLERDSHSLSHSFDFLLFFSLARSCIYFHTPYCVTILEIHACSL